MKPVFEILPEGIFFAETNFFCEASRESFSCFFQNDINKNISGLLIFNFDKIESQNISGTLNIIFSSQPLFQKKYKKTFISWSDAESILIPGELYKPGESESLLNTFYGDMEDSVILNDHLEDKKIYNVFRIPQAIQKTFIDQFPFAIISHQYTAIIKNCFKEKDIFRAIFYNNKIVVEVVKEGVLQIAQTYFYTSHEDVIYYLLNLCKHFDLHNIPIQLCGFIEKDSELYKKINFYFPDSIFDEKQKGQELQGKIKELPAHYFTHLFSLASCV